MHLLASIHRGDELAALIIILLSLMVGFATTVAYCFIFRKAGYSWALGLLMLIPVVNFLMLLFLAFAQWPVRRELDSLRYYTWGQSGYGPYQQWPQQQWQQQGYGQQPQGGQWTPPPQQPQQPPQPPQATQPPKQS